MVVAKLAIAGAVTPSYTCTFSPMKSDFFIDIVSEAFTGQTQIARHRAINLLLADGA